MKHTYSAATRGSRDVAVRRLRPARVPGLDIFCSARSPPLSSPAGEAVEPHWALIGSQQPYYDSQSHLLAASSCAAPATGLMAEVLAEGSANSGINTSSNFGVMRKP